VIQTCYTYWDKQGNFIQQRKQHHMSHNTYRQLPLDSLNELLCMAVKDLLTTLDKNEDGEIGFNARRKQVELLLDIINEKATERSAASDEFK